MVLKEKEIVRLEKSFINNSVTALANAHKRMRASGHSVIVSQNGNLYEIKSNGDFKFIKQLKTPILVERGQKILI